MPRYALTPEEFAAVEKMRVKNATNLGYNEGLEVARQHVLTFTPEEWPTGDYAAADIVTRLRRTLADHLNRLKRNITL